MIIKSIKYKNFRQFEKEGKIEFDTTGKISIIYGENGGGKSTLHQLFNWILYGTYRFNQTAERDLYNLHAASKLSADSFLTVFGEIEFFQNDDEYLARREWRYYKNKSGKIIHKEEHDRLIIQMKDNNNVWKALNNPETLIGSILPSGLSNYFFFDGETMIADLRKKGTDSAKNLKTALYSIFDLELYESALIDLGSFDRKYGVIGTLVDKKTKELANSSSFKEREKYANDIRRLRTVVDNNEQILQKHYENISMLETRIKENSEKIGQHQSSRQIEYARKTLIESKKNIEDSIIQVQKAFGKTVSDKYSLLLVTQVVLEAENRLALEVQDEEKRLIPGLVKELLINLINGSEDKCICGNHIGEKELEELKKWKNLFPPTSYKAIYDKFSKTAAKYSCEYKEDELLSYLKRVIESKQQIKNIEIKIDELDKSLKETGNIDELVDQRNADEKELRAIELSIKKLTEEITNNKHQIEIREKRLQKDKTSEKIVEKYDRKIQYVNQIVAAIKKKMKEDTEEYSSMLRDEIRLLIEKMLTSKRDVELDEDFILKVKDSFDNEAKSEGQFAVVTFAYVGGVLNVIKKHEKLKDKEFPLVLDGPFSKLDEKQKGNVINELPQFATQVIIFSKDNLEDWFDAESVGAVWTIKSNEEKNNAVIEEGNTLWR